VATSSMIMNSSMSSHCVGSRVVGEGPSGGEALKRSESIGWPNPLPSERVGIGEEAEADRVVFAAV